MLRTVEVGRAVLCSPATNLELWLTTLITISPLQDEIDIQQLKPAHVIDFLSSGDVWVERGPGMHVKLNVTLREETLAHRPLQNLAESILRAPVWDQLKLQPSLPVDTVSETGTIRLNINHINDGGLQEGQKRHRLFYDVPAADLRPPEGVPRVALQAIHFSMDILETTQRVRPTSKRPRTSRGEGRVAQSEPDILVREQAEYADILVYEAASVADASHDRGSVLVSRTPTKDRKRPRPATDRILRTTPVPVPPSTRTSGGRRWPVTDSFVQHSSLTTFAASDQADMEAMVDGAFRLSICGGLNKSSNGLKVKASTFRLGLAEIAPAMWRSGYLPALSQRAHLLPTISRSLSQVAGMRATSISLKDKLSSLAAIPNKVPAGGLIHKDVVVEQGFGHLTTAVVSQLWVHLQKNLHDKSTTPLQAFVASRTQMAYSDSDDMLAEAEVREKPQHISIQGTSSKVDHNEDIRATGDEIMSHEHPSLSTEREVNLPKMQILERSTNHNHESGEIKNDLLLDRLPPKTRPMVTSQEDEEFTPSDHGADVPASIQCTSLHEQTIQKPQHSLDTKQTAEGQSLSPGVPPFPSLTDTEHPPDDELLFEERQEQSIDSAENLVLAF